MAIEAVIDLGTNSFNLLIGRSEDGKKEIMYRESRIVQLAKEGITPIGDASLQRAMDALDVFQEKISNYKAERVRIIGTSALRSASNSDDVISKIQSRYHWEVSIIDGEAEARYIFVGTMEALQISDETCLIMDIGGGSVEFILTKAGKMLWWTSVPIGVQYLYLHFGRNVPTMSEEVAALERLLDLELAGLKKAIRQFKPERIVGASGAFDELLQMSAIPAGDKFTRLDTPIFYENFEKLQKQVTERRNISTMRTEERPEIVMTGFLLIRYVLQLIKVPEIIATPFALREGVFFMG